MEEKYKKEVMCEIEMAIVELVEAGFGEITIKVHNREIRVIEKRTKLKTIKTLTKSR